MTSIRTSDVVGQLRRSYEAEAKALAGSNTLISKTEAAKVQSAELRGAIAAITDGQPGARLNVDLVVDEAIKRALQRLGSINTAGTAFLSKAEIEALKKKQPDLGNRMAAAYDVAKAGVPATPAPVLAAVTAALTPWAGGTLPAIDVRLVKETSTARIVEVDVRRNDGRTVTAKVTLGRGAKENQVQAVSMFTDAHPVTGPVVASLQTALGGATVLGYVERVDARSGKTEFLTAYRTGNEVMLALVDPQTKMFAPTTLSSADEKTARTLALQMAKLSAYTLVSNDGDPAGKLEYHLRTGALKATSLKKTTNPDDSAVGFNPATDAFQFKLARVWGDISVFVTFGKDGSARVEDFN